MNFTLIEQNFLAISSYSSRNIRFQVIARRESCSTIDVFDEGVEVGLRLDSEGVWIPLAVIFKDFGRDGVPFTFGDMVDLVIRDYPVDPPNRMMLDEFVPAVNISLGLCGFEREPEFVQLRWLQTAGYAARGRFQKLWGLDDLQISYVHGNSEVILLSDSFDDQQLK